MSMLGVETRTEIDPSRSALLVIDMVNWQIPRRTADGPTATEYFVERLAGLTVPALTRLVPACRALGVRVVWLRVGSGRDDYLDAPPAVRERFAGANARDGRWTCEVIPELSQEEGDLDLLKPGSSAFVTTNLHDRLRPFGIVNLIHTGVITNACVMSTVYAGFDLGYTNYLITDATATKSQQLQDGCEHIIGLHLAELMKTDQLIDRLRSAVVSI